MLIIMAPSFLLSQIPVLYKFKFCFQPDACQSQAGVHLVLEITFANKVSMHGCVFTHKAITKSL